MKFIITLAVGLILVAVVSNYIYGGYDTYNLSNGFFAVGLPLFFGSIIILSGAKNVFISMGYTFKNIFNKQKRKYGDYYEYNQNKKDEDKASVFGLSTFIISIVFLIIAAYLGYQVI